MAKTAFSLYFSGFPTGTVPGTILVVCRAIVISVGYFRAYIIIPMLLGKLVNAKKGSTEVNNPVGPTCIYTTPW